MIKGKILALVFTMLCCLAYGQADFTWKVKEVSDKEVLLTISGKLEDKWHISHHQLKLEQQDGLRPIGSLSASGDGAGTEANGGSVVYRQRFAVTQADYHLKGYLQYVLCTDEMCLVPQTVEFTHDGVAAMPQSGADDGKKAADGGVKPVTKDSVAVAVTLQKDSAADVSFINSPAWNPVIDKLKSFGSAVQSPAPHEEQGGGMPLLRLFLFAFAGGLLALLTPCVWPMIPLTVSFFMKRGEKRGEKGGDVKGAVLFGGCIVVIFVVMGFLLTMLFGADALNKLSTSAVFNVVCFAVLVLFGLSLLGLFDLHLPSSWADVLDRKSNATTGIVSIFLMALTMVVVSFSCTAPVMGLLLVEIATVATGDGGAGALLMPVVGMTSFALALALPFTFFALFPKLLERVPRSGQWMMSVRVTLGFIELAFALKFLSVADLAYGWHILPREVFLVIWIVLAFACGIYHTVDWTRKRINPLRRQKVAVVCYAFVFYLIPGLKGAPCTLVSAFLPPAERTDEMVFTDYEEALAEARVQHKPVFIDFTGYGCVNCRKMEAAVFTDSRVRDMLYKEYVVLQLYVDDRTPLPQHLTVDGRTLRSVGDKWALLESRKFGSVAQPFYVIVDADGEPLTSSYAYDEDAERFLGWLSSVKR